MEALAAYRHTEFRGVEELTRAAATLSERLSAERARGARVLTTITERTVRHYLSEDLLGQPAGQAGTSLVFNYGNLLRLLAVKKLLAEHWSVLKVKEFMTALDTTALEQMVGATLRADAGATPGETQQGSVTPVPPVTSVTGEGAFDASASERGMADTSPDPAHRNSRRRWPRSPSNRHAAQSAPLWNGSSLLPDWRSRFAGAFVPRAIVRSASDWSRASGPSSIATRQRKSFNISARVTGLSRQPNIASSKRRIKNGCLGLGQFRE